ncbi:purine-cytosine permease family protein [Neobacillus sp. D3-1R]|uniref:purine-cytosine permease family protein n=1 Tax=Neobacillus sp. D3-1R TaxID=3445778 RepID=UPI003FA155AC
MSQQAKILPVNVEKFGLEPLPTHLKNSTWFDFFILQVAFSVNSGNFIVPALAVLNGKLPLIPAILSTVLGSAIAFLFVSFLTLPGSKYGLPSQYAIRSIIGSNLSRYVASPIRTITSLYWFAVQTIGGSLVFIKLFNALFGVALPFLMISILFAMLMGILALVGFEAVKKAIRSFLPFLIVGQCVLIYLLIKDFDWSTSIFLGGEMRTWSLSQFLFFASLAFVQYVSGVSASSDMARFARSEKAGFWGLYSGNLVGFIITATLGSFSAILFQDWNPFISIVYLSQSKLIIFLILLCSMSSMISINLSNAYTGGFSLLNTFQSLGRIKSATIFSIVALAISCFPIFVEHAQKYISLLGVLIIPISATIVADYLFIKKGLMNEKDLKKLYSQHWNVPAILSILIGVVSYLSFPREWSPSFLSFLLTVIVYIFSYQFKYKKDNQADS